MPFDDFQFASDNGHASMLHNKTRVLRQREGDNDDPEVEMATLAKKLLSTKDWKSLSSLPDMIRSSGEFPDKATCGRLIGGCIKARQFKTAEEFLRVFTARKVTATAAFSAALRGYNKLHMYNRTLFIHELMTAAGSSSDSNCFRWIMEAYYKLGKSDEVVSQFKLYKDKSMDSSSSSATNVQIYLILCDSLGRQGRATEALQYFRQMSKPGKGTESSMGRLYSSLVCSFAEEHDVSTAELLFREGRSKGFFRKEASVFLKLVLMYVEVGSMEKAMEVVKVMSGETTTIGVSDCIQCAIVNGHVKKTTLQASIKAYEDMKTLGCVPGQVTYASIINVHCRLNQTGEAEKIFSEMIDRGFTRCIVAYSNMVSMYGKSKRYGDAMKLVAKMKQQGCLPNVWVYNSLLDMHGKEGDLRQVDKVWKEMKRRKVEPDRVSYTSVITAHSKARKLDVCVDLFTEFRQEGGKIDRALAGIMVGVFSKTNRVGELIELLTDLKREGVRLDDRLYTSGLNGLRDAGLEAQANWFREEFG